MLRVLIKPTTYTITPHQNHQNPYIDIHRPINKSNGHNQLEKAFHYSDVVTYTIQKPRHALPDIVFVANGGLYLPRLPVPTILLPRMKYKQRQEELSYLKEIYTDLKLRMIPFPNEIFEGQAELKWFHNGTKAVGGYGYRSTKKTFQVMKDLFAKIYGKYNISPPEILALPIISDKFYHLDIAMLEFDDSCIIHRRAFSPESIRLLKKFLGHDKVYVIDSTDDFCINAIVDGPNLITHRMTESLKQKIEKITGRHIKMIDASEFEQSGGSVRCMVLDIRT